MLKQRWMSVLVLMVAAIIFSNVYLYSQQVTAPSVLTLKDFLDEAKAYVGEERILSPQLAKAKIDSTPNLLILDVSEKDEYNLGHLKGAILIPRGFLELKITKNDLYPEINKGIIPQADTPILLYCKLGGRSLLAAATLKKMGYKDIYNIKGGLDAWKAERLPLER